MSAEIVAAVTVGAALPRLREMLRLMGSGAFFAALLIWAIWLRPQILGGSTGFVLISGQSMEPGIRHGDLVVVRTEREYAIGDVIAYRIPEGDAGAGAVVIHRVTGGSAAEGFVTQGDNRELADQWRPRPRDVVGSLWLHVPAAGKVLGALARPIVLASGAALFAFLAVALSPPAPRPRRRPARARG